MSAEQLHNALNDLDDDMIEAVEALRSRKKKTFPIFRFAGLAACLCLLLGIGFWRLGAQNTQMEAANDQFHSQEYAPAETIAIIDIPTVLVAVTEYTPDGFTATVTDTLDTDLFPTGTAVTVYLPKETETALAGSGDDLLYGAAKDPTLNFAADTVQVSFTHWEETENGIVIYAKMIAGGQE